MELKPITELFEVWLLQNNHCFHYCPVKIMDGLYKFDGIIDSIGLEISNDTIETMIIFCGQNNEKYDHISLGYFDEVVLIKDKGYTDKGWRGDFQNRYYTSYEAMVFENLFEPIITYCNSYFVVENNLYLVSIETHGCTFALIGNGEDREEIDKLEKISQGIIREDTCKYQVTKWNLFKV